MRIICTLLFIFLFHFCKSQHHTINSFETSTIYIGVDNLLEIPLVDSLSGISIKTPGHIYIKRVHNNFILRTIKPSIKDVLYIQKNNITIDSIILSSQRMKLIQHVSLKNNQGLITPGLYSKKLILDFDKLKIDVNTPWLDVPVKAFDIVIYDDSNIYLKQTIVGDSFDFERFFNAVEDLSRDGTIKIQNIKVRTPWHDGEEPFDMIFNIK